MHPHSRQTGCTRNLSASHQSVPSHPLLLLQVGSYNVTAPGASLTIPASKVPTTTTNTTASDSTTTTIISSGNGTISPRPPNTTVAIGPSGAVNITTSSANGTTTTSAGPGAVVSLPGVMNVTVTNVTYSPPN